MKNKIFIFLCLMLLLIFTTVSQVTAAETTRAEVYIPEFGVTINGVAIDSAYSKYPLLVYKDITYIPLTWNYSSALGLSLNWEEEKGLEVKKSGKASLVAQEPQSSDNINKQCFASVADFQIKVNGKVINNKEEEYPILQFRGITYFPITWKYADQEFGWQVKWEEDKGLSITVKELTNKENTEETVKKEEDKLPLSLEILKRLDDKVQTIQSLNLDMKGTIETVFLQDDAAMKMTIYFDAVEKVKLPDELYLNADTRIELFTVVKKENALLTKEEKFEMYLIKDEGYMKTDDEEYWHKINGINQLDILEEVQGKIDLDVEVYERMGLIPRYAGTENIDGRKYHVIKGELEGSNFLQIINEYFIIEGIMEELEMQDHSTVEEMYNSMQGEYVYWIDVEKEESVKCNIKFSLQLPDDKLELPVQMNFDVQGAYDLGESINTPFVRIDKVAEEELEKIVKKDWVKI